MAELPRLLITAAGSGSGKTLVTCGILKHLNDSGKKVASFKCGPDYIDPMFHKAVLHIDSYNLDSFLMEPDTVLFLLAQGGAGKDIAVLEGVMGYYDGIAGTSVAASAYDIASITDTPAVLLVDCRGMSVSVVPFIQGFLHYKSESHIKGVILNQLSPGMYERIKAMIEGETGVKVCGYVPVLKDCILESRHLGLVMPYEMNGFQEKTEEIARILKDTLDMEALCALAREAPAVNCLDYADQVPVIPDETVRIGIARDEAFCFCYEDNLKLLRNLGAELIPFSPIRDAALPAQLDGLLLYGGYPELYAEKLSSNKAMRESIRLALQHGLPCMAECGGFMYLQEALIDADGKEYPMAGYLPGKSAWTKGLKRFGYLTLEGGLVFGREIGKIRAHEFHYYDSDICGDSFTAKKPLSDRKWECMYSTQSLLAGYPHLHYYANKNVAKAFLSACTKRRQKWKLSNSKRI